MEDEVSGWRRVDWGWGRGGRRMEVGLLCSPKHLGWTVAGPWSWSHPVTARLCVGKHLTLACYLREGWRSSFFRRRQNFGRNDAEVCWHSLPRVPEARVSLVRKAWTSSLRPCMFLWLVDVSCRICTRPRARCCMPLLQSSCWDL